MSIVRDNPFENVETSSLISVAVPVMRLKLKSVHLLHGWPADQEGRVYLPLFFTARPIEKASPSRLPVL